MLGRAENFVELMKNRTTNKCPDQTLFQAEEMKVFLISEC